MNVLAFVYEKIASGQLSTLGRMHNTRQLIPALYFTALVLILIPVFDAGTSVYPWHFGYSQWRYAAVGLLSNALLLPTLGVLLATVVAVSQEHKRTRRVLTALCWICAIALFLSILMFALDTAQSRKSIVSSMYFAFVVASLTAAAKMGVGAVSLIIFARANQDKIPKPIRMPPVAPQPPNPSKMLLNTKDRIS